ncbi:MAG: HAMP domain-containing histidine kinase [Candidatus Omnitrophica bacterium]|nr:HAMP domain-containing histidine kinase [Candidatus Omnitrophota bacterium]
MNPFRSVKFRLTIWYALVLALLLSVFSFLMYTELSRALFRDTDQNLRQEAIGIKQSIESYLQGISIGLTIMEESQYPLIPFQYPPELRFKLGEIFTAWEISGKRITKSSYLVRVVGLDHRPLIGNLSGWQTEIIFPNFERDSVFMEAGESFQTIHFQKKAIRLYYHMIRYNGHPLFVIQCGVSIQDLESALNRLAVIILVSIPGAVLAACIGGWFLARRTLRPIDLMITKARGINAAYLKGRLPRTQTGDEIDRLAETLNEMMDRIEKTTQAIQDFSSDISHELKTPLAIIRGEVDLALRRPRSPEALLETLRVIESEANELIRLVDDLLLLVRSDARKLRFEKKKVSLQHILEQSASRFEDRIKKKRIEWTTDIKEAVEVEGDPVYLKRLFSNLLDNAIKFTPEGGKIGLSLRVSSDQARVEVVDTGIGIEYEMQEKVFSRFYRTDKARSHEGAGLGLNIAKAICDAHQGSITIQSQPDRGTRVTVSLPILKSL